MQKHFATAARSLNEVLQPLVRWRVEWEGGSGLCMLRTDGLCVRVKNDEPCDGGVGLECHTSGKIPSYVALPMNYLGYIALGFTCVAPHSLGSSGSNSRTLCRPGSFR